MLKRVFFASLGVLLTVAGLIGLLVPILPGVLFLLLAAVCFSWSSPRLQRRLERHPGWRRGQNAVSRARRRWQASTSLPLLGRLQLAFWLSAEATMKMVGQGRRGA